MLREKQRIELLHAEHARLTAVYCVWQRDVESGDQVRQVIAQRLEDLTSEPVQVGPKKYRLKIIFSATPS